MTIPGHIETVSKLDAARRQLSTAIDLWFNDRDSVSTHALAYAAYDVIHTLSRKQGRKRSLLIDYDGVKDDHKKIFRDAVRRAGNYFKHADRDPDEALQFNPVSNEIFIFFAILGVELMGLKINKVERTFILWLCLNNPGWLTKEGRVMFSENIPINTLSELRNIPKQEFFQLCL